MPGFSSIDLRSIRIERDQTETIFGQLCRQLRELILRGDLPIDARLPSTRILAIEIGVSRITVREVYEHLVAEGFLTSAAGKGTFVSHHAALREAILFKVVMLPTDLKLKMRLYPIIFRIEQNRFCPFH